MLSRESNWEYKKRKENPHQSAARMRKDFGKDRLWERLTNSIDIARQSKEQDVVDHYTMVWKILKGQDQQLVKLESHSLPL